MPHAVRKARWMAHPQALAALLAADGDLMRRTRAWLAGVEAWIGESASEIDARTGRWDAALAAIHHAVVESANTAEN